MFIPTTIPFYHMLIAHTLLSKTIKQRRKDYRNQVTCHVAQCIMLSLACFCCLRKTQYSQTSTVINSFWYFYIIVHYEISLFAPVISKVHKKTVYFCLNALDIKAGKKYEEFFYLSCSKLEISVFLCNNKNSVLEKSEI